MRLRDVSKILLPVLVFSAFSTNAIAKSHYKFQISLAEIAMLDSYEKYGDELFLNIVEYGPNDYTNFYTIPVKPTYWMAEHLDKVKDVKLWEKDLEQGQNYTVLVELTEHDAPPWNPDDLVGIVKVKLSYDGITPSYQWRMPNRPETASSGELKKPYTQEFQMKDEHGAYEITLKVEAMKQ